jgi:hypothetical protein
MWWKNGLRGLFKPVRLGQVRKAVKSWKSEAMRSLIHLLDCFGWKFERTVFERKTLSQIILRNKISLEQSNPFEGIESI